MFDRNIISAELHHKHRNLTAAWNALDICVSEGRNRTTVALSHWNRNLSLRIFDAWRLCLVSIRHQAQRNELALQFRNKKLLSGTFHMLLKASAIARYHLLRAVRWESNVLVPRRTHYLLCSSFRNWYQVVFSKSLIARKRHAERLLLQTFDDWNAVPRVRVEHKKFVHQAYAAQFRWLCLVRGSFVRWRLACSSMITGIRFHRRIHQLTAFGHLKSWLQSAHVFQRNQVAALQHWAFCLQRFAFRGWKDRWESTRRLCNIECKMLQRRAHHFKANALSCLHSHIALKRSKQAACRHHSDSLLKHSVCVWKRNVSLLSSMARVAKFGDKQRLRHIWGYLVSWLSANRQIEMNKVAEGTERNGTLRKRHALAMLSSYRTRSCLNRIAMNTAVRSRRIKSVRSCLDQWKCWLGSRTQKRACVARSYVHRTCVLRRTCFHQWFRFHQWFKQERVKLIRAGQLHRTHLLQFGFTGMKAQYELGLDDKRLAQLAVQWRRNFLIKAGVSAWLTNAQEEAAAQNRKQQESDFQRATRIKDLVSRIAFHWLRKTFGDTRRKQRAHRARNVNIDIGRTQTRLCMGWMNEMPSQLPRHRPPPRKPLDYHLESSMKDSIFRDRNRQERSILQGDDFLAQTLKDFVDSKIQAQKDHHKRFEVRQRIRELQSNEWSFEQEEEIKKNLELLSVLQAKKLRFEEKRACLLPLIKSSIK